PRPGHATAAAARRGRRRPPAPQPGGLPHARRGRPAQALPLNLHRPFGTDFTAPPRTCTSADDPTGTSTVSSSTPLTSVPDTPMRPRTLSNSSWAHETPAVAFGRT